MKLIRYDTEIPALIGRFLELLDIANGPLNEQHFLLPLIARYIIWDKTQNLHKIPSEVWRLATIAANVLAFKNDWSNPAAKSWLVNRLRNQDQVKGVLFEFRAAMHYLRFCEKVTWLPNVEFGGADLRIVTRSGAIVYTECTRKDDVPARLAEDGRLHSDILRSLKRKMRQRQGFSFPLHLVIYVPDDFSSLSEQVNDKLRRKIDRRFEMEQYRVIGAITVLFNDLPQVLRGPSGLRYLDSSLPKITCLNKNPSHPFPIDFKAYI